MIRYQDFGLESSLLDDVINGRKTIEGRLNAGKFVDYNVGDIVKLRRDYRDESGVMSDGEADQARVRIVAIRSYASFRDMLVAEDYRQAVPSAASATEAVAEYGRHYSDEQQSRYGVLAIEIAVV